ncbi:hypothetical protein COLO4_07656 [Corchorus olitorius]|uniref:TF-B3 domain-containing protein n=1 Tax=Corchorus olitorius TaxID=93759 RepID=A0A1R3KJ05_9ROSI|nr:hypothetical protein COLO4_07656 [Corchorus olitorius]
MQPIPKKFVRQYGKLLPRLVNVEVPSGGVWEVEVAKCDCDPWMWLQKGWPEFAKHFSLKCGHFLVFRYQGNAHFHVSIFDKTATEIEYPYVISSKGNNNTWECRKRRRHKSDMPLPCPQPHKKLKSQASAPVAKGKSPALEVRCLKNAEKVEALKKASDFTSKNPFFMLVMQPSCLGFRGRVSIPVSFARENIKIQNATLILSSSTCNGKTWPARYYCMHKKNTVQHLIQGVNWEAFAKDNALQVGDVCVFELTEIMRPQIMLKVSIYPATSNGE